MCTWSRSPPKASKGEAMARKMVPSPVANESKRQKGPDSESDEKRLKDFPQRRVRTRVQPYWRKRRSVLKTRSM